MGVSRRGEIKIPLELSIDTPGSNDSGFFLGVPLWRVLLHLLYMAFFSKAWRCASSIIYFSVDDTLA